MPELEVRDRMIAVFGYLCFMGEFIFRRDRRGLRAEYQGKKPELKKEPRKNTAIGSVIRVISTLVSSTLAVSLIRFTFLLSGE